MALILHLQPVDFEKMSLPLGAWILFRLPASFCGVFGFSVMFNSPVRPLRLQQGSEQLQIRSGWSWWILRHVHLAAAAFMGLWLQVCWLL